MKKIILLIIFIIGLMFIILSYDKIVRSKIYAHNISQYYNEKNNIDVFFLGSSRIYYPMSPMYIWHKYGVVSYNRGASGQYYKISYILEEEIFKKYKPKLIVFDIAYLQSLSFEGPNRVDISLANLKNNYFKYYAYKYIYNNKKEALKHMNTIDRFHTRWKELNKYDFNTESYWKGQYTGSYVTKGMWDKLHLIFPIQNNNYDDIDNIVLDTKSVQYAEMMVNLAEKNKCKILFVKIIHQSSKNSIEYDNAFKELAENKGWNFIDYNKMNNILNINFKTDMKDWSHLNLYGSRKVMDHLIPYIIENYDIPVRKGDPKYKKWDEDYIKYARVINREEIRELPDFNRWKIQAFYDNYTVMISSNNNVMNKLPQDIKSFLKSKGLTKYETNKANMRYVAIIDDNKVFFEEISEKPVEYKGRMKRKVNLLVKSDGNSIINVSGKQRSKNKYGLNMVVYDKVNKEVVDSIWIEPNKPNEIRR